LLFFPAMVLVAGVWGTMVSLYTIPFRSGRDAFWPRCSCPGGMRCAWRGFMVRLARFLLVFVGWVWVCFGLASGYLANAEEPRHVAFAMLDSSSRQPGVPWIAFMLLLFWSAIEATIFTFTLRPR